MKKKLSVGIIGLGRIYPRHVDDAIKQIDELKLAAVCDIKKDTAQTIGKKETVPFYTDYKQLIKNKNIDIVAVCTPNGLHYEMGLAIAKANKHCVMEKPIAQTYLKSKQLVKAFKNSKGMLFPVLQVRYNPAVQILKEYVEKGSLGKILTASVIIRWSRPQEYFDKSDWKGTRKMDGGTLLTQGIHYIDIMQYILGPAKTVFGKTGKVAHRIETEDISNAIIDLSSGIRVNLEFTVCTYPHNLECSLTVLGERGTIKIGGNAMNVCEIWEVKDTPKPIIPTGFEPNIYAGGMYVGSCPNHKSIYQNLVNVLVHKQPLFIKAEDALESIKIIDAIKKSSEQKKEIEL
jgi:predicted dehydrogenase